MGSNYLATSRKITNCSDLYMNFFLEEIIWSDPCRLIFEGCIEER